MKNKKSINLIVGISLFVGLLQLLIGPNYQGALKSFISGYLIDILLPLNFYLLLQIAFRKIFKVNKSRVIGATFTFFFGVFVEILQFYKIEFFGKTYDPLDIVMYGFGVGLGLLLDFIIINKLENCNN